MRPFCANPMCIANQALVEDEQMELEGDLGDVNISLTRVLAAHPGKKVVVPFCNACAETFKIVEGSSKPLPVGIHGDAFCSNKECFAHDIDIPDDQEWFEVSLGSGHSRRFEREWLQIDDDAQPFCSSCSNVFNIIAGDPQYPDAEEGFESTITAA